MRFMQSNPYLPKQVKIKAIRRETHDVKTFVFNYKPRYFPGQFFEVSLYGYGEVPISATSSPLEKNLELSIKKAGHLTNKLYELKVGDKVGLRGPMGNSFPIAAFLSHAPIQAAIRLAPEVRTESF